MNADLRTRYLGLELRNPIVAASTPLTGKLDNLKQLEEAGVGAVVLPSLFEEQIEHEEMELHQAQAGPADAFAEALSFFPKMQGDLRSTPEKYLDGVRAAKAALSVPVIASLNGVSTGGWVGYAKRMQDAGADAIELNIYHVETDPEATAEQVEQRYVELVEQVRAEISVPLAVKIGPYFSSLPAMARKLQQAGATGLVLFNRFMQPDVDLASRDVATHVELSSSTELRLPLRWIAILKGRVDVSLAATTGVHEPEDALKVIAAGADVAMMASALLRHGPWHVKEVVSGMEKWLVDNDFNSIEQLRGSVSQQKAADPRAFERANYMKALISYSAK